MALELPADQVSRKQIVGKLDGDDVWALEFVGGLNVLVCKRKSGKTDVLGSGSHRCIAEHIASKRNPALQISDLKKSEHYPLEVFQHLVPQWEARTDNLRRIQARRG